jgi:hypothetical protein
MLTLDLVAIVVSRVLILASVSYLVSLANGIKQEVAGLKSSAGDERMNLQQAIRLETQQLKAFLEDEASKADAQVMQQISQLGQASREASEAVNARLGYHEKGVLASLESLRKAHADIRDAYADMQSSRAEALGKLQPRLRG